MAHKNATKERQAYVAATPLRLSHAEEARNLLVRHSGTAALSTWLVEESEGAPAQYPFGSVIKTAFDAQGNILFLVSQIAEHYANISHNPHVSLLFTEEMHGAKGEQLALSRVTVVGEAVVLPDKPQAVREAYFAKNPDAEKYAMWDDFRFCVVSRVHRVRYIKGFGEMSWIPVDEFHKAVRGDSGGEGDSNFLRSKECLDAVDHMNADHAKQVVEMVRFFHSCPDVAEAAIVRFDASGFDCKYKTAEGTEWIAARIQFDKPLAHPRELRENVVGLSKRAAAVAVVG